jgi:hypothetical protein
MRAIAAGKAIACASRNPFKAMSFASVTWFPANK